MASGSAFSSDVHQRVGGSGIWDRMEERGSSKEATWAGVYSNVSKERREEKVVQVKKGKVDLPLISVAPGVRVDKVRFGRAVFNPPHVPLDRTRRIVTVSLLQKHFQAFKC